jgi:type VI secretion system protein
MALKLRVISDHYKVLGKRSSRLFGVHGGRIGRSQDNDWVLPDEDRYISSHHCKVNFKSGEWELEDTSTNGVFVNGDNSPVSVNGAYSLKDGDRLRMGDYELLVSIDEQSDFPPDASGQIPSPMAAAPAPRRTNIAAGGDDLGEELDLTDLIIDSNSLSPLELTNAYGIGVNGRKAPPLPPAQPMPVRNALASLLNISAEESDSLLTNKPKDTELWAMETQPYDPKKLDDLANPPRTGERKRPSRPGDLQVGVDEVCRGMGIDPESLDVETHAAFLTLVGQMLRESILGLMESHKGINDLCNRLDLRKPATGGPEQNPLRVSAAFNDAMASLFDSTDRRKLGPIDAIRDSFRDLKSHQHAVGTAVHAAVNQFMEHMDPRALQERFDRNPKRGGLLSSNSKKYWEMYTEYFHAVNQRNGRGLPPVFGDELSRVYGEKKAG